MSRGHLAGEPIEKLETLFAAGLGALAQLGRPLLRDVFEGVRVEVVVRKHHETKACAIEILHFLKDGVSRTHAGNPAVLDPHGAEGARLRAAADRLNRRDEISIQRHQIPSRRDKAFAGDPSAAVCSLHATRRVIGEQVGPGDLAVAGHDGIAVP